MPHLDDFLFLVRSRGQWQQEIAASYFLEVVGNRRERRENKAQGGEKPECTKGVHEDFEPPSNAVIPSAVGFTTTS